MRRLILLAVLVATLSVLFAPESQALQTDASCDALTAKYYCFRTDWTDFGTYVSVDDLEYTGYTGCCISFYEFTRMEFNLWRQDPSTSTWYELASFGSQGPFTDNTFLWDVIHHDYRGYYVSDWSDVQTRDKHHQMDGRWWCYWTVDFHLHSPQGTWIEKSSNQTFC